MAQVALSTNGGAPNTSVQWYEVTAATHGVEPIVRSQSLELVSAGAGRGCCCCASQCHCREVRTGRPHLPPPLSLSQGANSIDIFEPNPRAPVLCGRSWFFAVRSQARRLAAHHVLLWVHGGDGPAARTSQPARLDASSPPKTRLSTCRAGQDRPVVGQLYL